MAMYQIYTRQENKNKVYELANSDYSSWLKVVPERGGIITGLGLLGEELLFLNKETLDNPEKNIRGGIPILFPISGQLEDGKYEWNGTVYHMKNHGVARNLPWEVIETSADASQASISLCLKSNAETIKSFPFEFELIFTYVLTEEGLTIKQEYRNNSDTAMPIYAGFHPYFKTASKNLLYQTDATSYVDYNDMERKEINGSLDLTDKKESFILMDAQEREISFELHDRKKTITLTYGDEFKYVVIWQENNQEFVCVEPWMAMTNELNRKEELVMIQPGEILTTAMGISAR
ncbi:MAG: aldose epimerase [Bacillus sp. (in: Bacteria)]|nr:aldose epimerase [Bacillus sp. (in: firmicutes)]